MSTLPAFSDLEWLVDSRSKIQHLLLDLYAFGGKISADDVSRTLAFQLLTAIGFALWRAAFLADDDRSWPEITKDASTFLGTLVRDNAIGYTQDRTSKRWTFGYYINDAYLRLDYFHRQLRSLEPAHVDRVAAFLEAQGTRSESEPDSHVAWDHAYEAALDAFRTVSTSE